MVQQPAGPFSGSDALDISMRIKTPESKLFQVSTGGHGNNSWISIHIIHGNVSSDSFSYVIMNDEEVHQ